MICTSLRGWITRSYCLSLRVRVSKCSKFVASYDFVLTGVITNRRMYVKNIGKTWCLRHPFRMFYSKNIFELQERFSYKSTKQKLSIGIYFWIFFLFFFSNCSKCRFVFFFFFSSAWLKLEEIRSGNLPAVL